MEWYYALNGGRQGPVTEQKLQELVTQGVITADTLVWRQGMADWQKYGAVNPPAAVPSPAPASPVDAPSNAFIAPDTAVCAMSGKTYPKSQMVEHEGRWVSLEHRDAYFQRIREGVGLPGVRVYGGFWVRVVAKIIDGIITGVINAVLNMLILGVGIAGAQMDPNNPGAFFAVQALAMVMNMAFSLLYTWFFLSKFQATPGKMVFGLIVIRADGSPLSSGRIIGRYFAEILSSLILCIGYLMVAFDEKEKKGLHDMLCETRVVKK